MTRRKRLMEEASRYALRAQQSEARDNFRGSHSHRTMILKMVSCIYWRCVNNVPSPND